MHLLKSADIDVMLLDISMRPYDGWKTLERVRRDPSIADTPAIRLSARKFLENEAEELSLARGRGPPKLINTQNLMAAIERAIERKRRLAPAEADDSPDPETPWPGGIVSFVGAVSLARAEQGGRYPAK